MLMIQRQKSHALAGRILMIFSSIAIFLWCISATSLTRADMIVSIDFDPITPGIQNSITVMQGQSLSANIVLQYSDAVGLDSYQFSVSFDDNALTGLTVVQFAPSGFEEYAGNPVISGSVITPFNGASIDVSNGPASIAPTIVGTLELSAGVGLGDFFITPYEDGLFDGSFTNDFMLPPITPQFNFGTVTITAIPEPSAMVLCVWAVPILLSRIPRRNSKFT